MSEQTQRHTWTMLISNTPRVTARSAANERKERLMARLLKQANGKRMGLPGRSALEMVSGAIGSRVTFCIVEIPVAKPGETLRGPHLHHGYEECMYVLKGTGVTMSESGELALQAGDVVLVPAEEKHVTRNTGSEPLVLLCFFPTPDIVSTTENFADF
jgi:mannose-6-phosphate isomerase-like protein (cupin superfamily)